MSVPVVGGSGSIAHRLGLPAPARAGAVEGLLLRGSGLPVSLLIAILTWPVLSLAPGWNLDPSWQIALHLAAAGQLRFGREIVFSYGPLGYLSQPLLITSATGIESFVYAVVAQVALCLVLLRSTLRTFAWPLALVVTYLAAAIPELLVSVPLIVVFFGCVWALERDRPPAMGWLVPIGGALAAFQLLLKLNGGVLCLAMLVLTAWHLRPRRLRSEFLLALSFAASLIALWWLTGNPPRNLATWLQRSWSVVSGYSAGMAIDSTTELRAYLLAILAILFGAHLLIRRARLPSRSRALCLAGVVAIYLFASVKEGFVRHDPTHDLYFLGLVSVGVLAFDWRRLPRSNTSLKFSAALLSLALLGSLLLTAGSTRLYRPDLSAAAVFREGWVLASGSRRESAIRSGRASVRSELRVSPRLLRGLRGYSVDVEPYLTSAVWAYDLRWRPEPLIQSYAAYTASLDRFNASFLERRGAARILRRGGKVIDRKMPAFEAPASFVAVLCRYRDLQHVGMWFVLGRVPNRCGHAYLLGRTTGTAGQAVLVPSAPNRHAVVFARIRIRQTLLGRLQDVLFKPFRLPTITLSRDRRYRLEAATAGDPLVLRLPSGSGIASAFGGALDASSITLRNVSSPFEVEFFAMSLASP
jgi:hypothetical protein